MFAERYRLRNNWLKGRCTVRTFEGHSQGISCVQFDDTRIVSGSSDKTIKVSKTTICEKWQFLYPQLIKLRGSILESADCWSGGWRPSAGVTKLPLFRNSYLSI